MCTGLSKIFADDAAGEVIMKTACGTPGYVAPEVLGHEAYSSQVWRGLSQIALFRVNCPSL